MPTDDAMTISEMCEAFDVTPRTLRFYEAKELLFPIRQGTRRLFTKRDRGRLKLILRGKRFGFSLEDIRQLLALYDITGMKEVQIRAVCNQARERLVDMARQRDELGALVQELQGYIDWGEQEAARLEAARTAQ